MITKNAYTYVHNTSGKKLTLRHVNLYKDIGLLHNWFNQAHVIPYWQLNKPRHELCQYFYKAMTNSKQLIFIVTIDGHEVAYAETYAAHNDRLANFYPVTTGDYGLHLLIGPPQAVGQGYAELILCALTDYLFTCHKAKRVIVEPDIRVKQLEILKSKLGFTDEGIFKLPEKQAKLYSITAKQYYKHYPPTSKQLLPSNIHVSNVEWPLLRMHFPTKTTEQDVYRWLHNIDLFLQTQQACVVISTFDPDYQFSPSARKYQALWFKHRRHLLKQYCLAMIRVTQNQAMIDKLNSKAMRKGMPFSCLPAFSIYEAEKIAQQKLRVTNVQS